MEEKSILMAEDLRKYPSIDTMCHFAYCRPELVKHMFERYEYKIMAKTTFAGVARRLKLKPGEEWRVLAGLGKGSVEAMIAEMDEVGVKYTFIETLTHWSWHDHQLMCDVNADMIADIVREAKGRVIGGGGYNPFQIKESLEDLEKAVKEHGFKWVWCHPISFGMKPSDRRCYPLYTKCLEYGIPVCIQVGHSAENLHSEPGHPMYVEDIALDFPDLKIVLTHTGWPWVEEWISMVWRYPNVYGNIGAYYPKDLESAQVRFMDGRGRDKVLWATRGFGFTRCKQEFLQLPIREESKRKILYENAVKVFNLD